MSMPILAICDQEIRFINKLTETFRNKNVPFEIHGFTNDAICRDFCRSNEVALLIISETGWEAEEEKLPAKCIIILRESERQLSGATGHINKFQSASLIFGQIMEIYAEHGKITEIVSDRSGSAEIIGIYSPVHRCLQTNLALTMGEMLAQKGPALYINFECFSGFESLFGTKFHGNLTDLLYYYECARETLLFRMKGIVQKAGDLDVIPPGESFFDFQDMAGDTWKEFLGEIARIGNYHYLILDLSEQVNGLFEILRICNKIYTVVKEDRMSQAKLAQYELFLNHANYADIAEKTKKCVLPIFRHLPMDICNMTNGELAHYVKKMISDKVAENEPYRYGKGIGME